MSTFMHALLNRLAALGLPALPSYNPDTVTALLWAREVMQQHLAISYQVNNRDGIDELKSVPIGGVEQWLHIRGRNKKNPVLLFVHGGPEAPMLGCLDAVQRPWEDYFTVVQWDQRQTGKSYKSADDKNNPLTIEQYVSDTEAVIEYLLNHLGQKKVFLLGFSWGSVLGMHVAKRKPDYLYAHIGMGQVVNYKDTQRIAHERLVHHASEHNEYKLQKKLLEIEKHLDDPAQYLLQHGSFVQQGLSRLAGESMLHHGSIGDLGNILSLGRLISPHFNLADIGNIFLGDEDALFRPSSNLINEFVAINLPEQLGNSFDVPVIFFSGSHDWQTPTVLSDQWFSQITAPYKNCLHFKESAHVIPFEEPGKLLMALVNDVLPLADGAESGLDNNA